MKNIALLVGARPNFMKIAPLYRAIEKAMPAADQLLIHTGQHYDGNMSRIFFNDLGMPEPDIYLGVGAGTHAVQTARVMTELDPILAEKRPDLLMVVGDVNSTLAGTLVAVKLHIPVAHVEAGLRSGDRRMPEEINRIVTDALSDMLLTSCMDGNRNLEDEGVPKERIHFVGNIMIDSLVGMLERSRKSAILDELGLETKKYICITLHRPSNVDTPETLRSVLDALDDAARDMPVIFPVHPRTRKNIAALDWTPKHDNFRLEEPLGYIDFLRLMSESSLVITDSGGIQEETSFLGIPCLTVRENTERPITITEGTNRLVDSDRDTLSSAIREALSRAGEPKPQIKYWDGHTAERIVDVLQSRQISFAGTP